MSEQEGEGGADRPVQPDDFVFDHHSPEMPECSHAIFARLREECPVAHSPRYGGFSVITRYEDVARIARDDTTFSSDWTEDGPQKGVAIPPTLHRYGFIMMDPPRSLQFRRALNPLTSREAVAALEPKWQALVTSAVDDFIELGQCDVVTQYTARIPAVITLDLLGLDIADWPLYSEFFSHQVTADQESAEYAERHGPDNWVLRKLADEVAARRQEPRDDGLTSFISRDIGGAIMTDEDAIDSVMLIMKGGFDTTSALLANTFVYLSAHHEVRARLIDDPSLLDSACEEFLRYFSPVQHLGRTVMSSTAVAGRRLEPGDRILLSWAAANLDPQEFPDPERVDLERFPNRHLAFGVGTHRCAGMHVLRSDFRMAVSEILTRIPDFEVHPDQGVRFESIGSDNGWHSLPMTFTPSVRSNVGSTSAV